MAGGAVVSGGSSGNPLRTGFIRREYLWAFILVTSLFFLWGFAYGLLDVLNQHFRKLLGVTRTQSSGLQAAYFGVGYFFFSPIAGEVLRRRGYKFTIIMGLALYSLGAILFWPVAHSAGKANNQAVFGGFVVCTAVIACGLASLEVSANSYVSVMPPHNVANFRLQFSQAFNGVASFTGPLIASKYFFSGEHADNLTSVQWTYLGVSLLGVVVALAFVFTKLPEVSEDVLQAEAEALAELEGADPQTLKPFYKQTRALTGALAQFLYVGAQVAIGACFLFNTEEQGLTDSRGSQLLSYGLILFTVGRFVGTALLSFISAPVLLFVYAILCTLCCVLIGSLSGMGSVSMMMIVMFFESIMYPVIFVLATQNLGRHTRRAASVVVMGVSGGAVFPVAQNAISDRWTPKVSFFLNVPCFVYIALWALYVWNQSGRKMLATTGGAVEREVEATAAATIPVAQATVLHRQGSNVSDVKQDVQMYE